MHKKFKSYINIFTLFIVFSASFAINKDSRAEIQIEENADVVHLVLDSLSYNNELPKNFRKTSDLTKIMNNKTLNLSGLDKLNASGSQQFSEFNLPILIKAIDTSQPIKVVDLRQESHGFINGLAVSWKNSKNNANEGLTREQVLVDEDNKLKSIKLNVPLAFYNKPNEIIIPTKVQDEDGLVKSINLGYTRITVRDGGIPTDDMVDYFIDFVKSQNQNTWLHFHCKEGVGRTTTFMIMYDMVKNNKDLNADDIIKRQIELADFDNKTISDFYTKERIDFLNKFYAYCKANSGSFNSKWSEWNKTKSSNQYIIRDFCKMQKSFLNPGKITFNKN